MISNYDIDHNGVIYQKDKNVIKYDASYVVNRYDTYGELSNYMGYLRLGFIVGAIARIPTSILDIGYGNGAFLKVCSNIVSKCYGNDISGYNLPDKCTFIDNVEKEHFDVVTFYDSLEHFEDISIVKKLKCNYVCISVPWCHYHDDDWFTNWKHRRPNEHLHHFNETSLKSFMKECGYSLIASSNIEDTIRKNKYEKNILTAIFKNEKNIL